MQRYSNLDTVSKTLQVLRSAGLISPDGSPANRSGRSDDLPDLDQPFKLDQRLKAETVVEIVARYEAGEPSTALAYKFRISKGSVIRLLREAGVQIRNQGLTREQIGQAAELYESGLSLSKIGTQFGVDPTTVHRQLRKCGVKLRDTHGRRT